MIKFYWVLFQNLTTKLNNMGHAIWIKNIPTYHYGHQKKNVTLLYYWTHRKKLNWLFTSLRLIYVKTDRPSNGPYTQNPLNWFTEPYWQIKVLKLLWLHPWQSRNTTFTGYTQRLLTKRGPRESCLYTILACHGTLNMGLRDGISMTKFGTKLSKIWHFKLVIIFPNPVYYRIHQLQERISIQRPQSLTIRLPSWNFLAKTMATVFFFLSEGLVLRTGNSGSPEKFFHKNSETKSDIVTNKLAIKSKDEIIKFIKTWI